MDAGDKDRLTTVVFRSFHASCKTIIAPLPIHCVEMDDLREN